MLFKSCLGMRVRIRLIITAIVFFVYGTVFAQDVYSPYIPHESEIIFNQSTFDIDVIDPKPFTNRKGANYPGLRGANQLVIYTPSFGYRTGTNEYGTEAVITGDTVSSLSGADSLIPANGLVISGHGTAKKWINENIVVGTKVYLDLENKKVTSYITSDTFLYGARERIKEVREMTSYYVQNIPNYNGKRAAQNMEKANDFISKAAKNSGCSQKYAAKAIEYANLAMSAAIPYNPQEFKGVWIRPIYYDEESIKEVLDLLYQSGIDNIFLETYYHGQTIFPSQTMAKYGFIKQNPDFAGLDHLKIWICEAHKRGMKVHVWFETFYAGNKPPDANPQSILAQKPEWANYQKRNADSGVIAYSVSEHNGYFIDPANPEANDFLYELLKEIIKYKPDGINLDYIRYPQSLDTSYPNYDLSNWGYTKYAREEFESLYGVDPIELKPSDELWYQWKFYRCNKITNFVRKVSMLCRYNGIMFTTVIFPNREKALNTKMQDWRTWSMNDFTDGFTPLFLTCDDNTAMSLMSEILRNKSSSTKLYAGLFVTFMNGAEEDLLKQIHASRRYGLNGVIIFDYAHLNNNYLEVLTESVFKKPGRSVSVKKIYKDR